MIPAGISVSLGLGAAQVADLACSETTHFLVEEWINDRHRLTKGCRIGGRADGDASTSGAFMNSVGTAAQ